MRYCLFRRLLVPSLVLSGAMVALWVRSYSQADFVMLWDHAGRCGYLCTVRGELRLVNEPSWSASNQYYFSEPSENVGYLSMKSYRRDVTIPLWLVLSAAIPWLV